MSIARAVPVAVLLLCGAAGALPAQQLQQSRLGDLTLKTGDVPRRIVGYGLVVGLDGTGDRSVGGFSGETPTIRSVVNLLRRFNIQVPPLALQSRNVAAVLVTAEVSPYLRAGGRFEVQVSSLGDATSLKGGVLWITPLVTDPYEPPVATAQGPILVAGSTGGETSSSGGTSTRRGNSGRIPEGGILEVEQAVAAPTATRLQLRKPDLGVATRIADVVNAAFGAGTAAVVDPGVIDIKPKAPATDNVMGFLAALDTLPVGVPVASRIVISARDGTVVAGGDVRVGPAAVSHRGITLRIGGGTDSTTAQGLLGLKPGATVQEVAAGLHAAGATSAEVAAIFESLVEVGALGAQVVIR